MNDIPDTPATRRSIWLRALFMLLMALAYHLTSTVLWFVTVIQFLIVLMNDQPNERLVAFGRSIGRYLQQLANYLSFVSEDIPFPFSDWPRGG